jgi:hypothetical protein
MNRDRQSSAYAVDFKLVMVKNLQWFYFKKITLPLPENSALEDCMGNCRVLILLGEFYLKAKQFDWGGRT